MSLYAQSIPNLIGGISQQPDSLRQVSQLESQENMFPSPVEGLIRRPPTEHIAVISETPLGNAFIHMINRTNTERYSLILSTGGIKIFDLDGNQKTINYIDEELTLIENQAVTGNGSAYTLSTANGETSLDFTATGIGAATVHLLGTTTPSNANSWLVMSTISTDSTNLNVPIGSNTYVKVWVSSYGSGSIDASITYKNARYINTTTPQESLRALTVADFTFIINTEKVPVMETANSATRPYEALIFVKQGNPGSTYRIYVNEANAAFYVTSDTVLATYQTTEIALQLYNDLLVSLPGYSIYYAANSSVIGIANTTSDFTIRVSDPHSGNDIQAFKDITRTFTELPNEAGANFTLAIDADLENDKGEYFVKAVQNQAVANTLLASPCTWEECAEPGISYRIDAATMPYKLVHQNDDSFTFEQIAWSDRVVGDPDSNPDPSFIGFTINDVYFYKNRLGFLSDENFILSEIGEYFNFFRTTMVQIKDSDMIDARATHTKVSILKRVVPFNKSLMLFSDLTQFIIPNDAVMAPKSVRVDVIAEYTSSTMAAPVNAGKVVLFMFDRGDYEGMNEFTLSDQQVDTYEADDVTSHVPSYIPSGVSRIAVSTLAGTTALLTTGDPTKIYLYKTEYANGRKVQRAWFRWDLGEYTNTSTTILSSDFIDSILYLIVQRDTGVFLEKIRLIPNQLDDFANYVTCLDRRITNEDCSNVSYSAANNQTTLTLPYTITSNNMLVITRSVANNDPYMDIGRSLTVRSANVGGNVVVVSGNSAVNPLWIGQRYLSTAELSTIYVRTTSPSGSQIIDATTKVQLLKGAVIYSQSGPFTVRVSPEGRPDSDYIFTGRLVGDTDSIIGEMNLTSGRFPFSILSNNERCVIQLRADSFLPIHLSSIEIEANVTKRARGRN